MRWHIRRILYTSFAFIMSLLLLSLVFIIVVGLLRDGNSLAFLVGFIFVPLFLYGVSTNGKNLSVAITKYRGAKDPELIKELSQIIPFNSYAQMRAALNAQLNNIFYQDEKVVLTSSFLGVYKDQRIFYIDGILDVTSYVYRVNGMIDYVSLIFLYCDGMRYDIKYRDSMFGMGCDLKKKSNDINIVANIIARRSRYFRKHSEYRFED